MKKLSITKLLSLLLIFLLTLSATSCGQHGSTIDEPDEITVAYLSGEYADQLVRDGAEVTLGTISVEADENDAYSVTVNSMSIVESDMTDAGYYVADKNISSTVSLDPAARITYINEPGSEPEIITPQQLSDNLSADGFDPLEEGNEKLFDVYTISETCLMILAKDLPATE